MESQNNPGLITFLGNSGSRYALTRHNVGWRLADCLVDEPQGAWQSKFKASWIKTTIGSAAVVALLPQTMMNLSGESVQAACRFFRFGPDEVAVAHDDVELPFGEIGVRLGGGLGGHNGLRSVEHCLGTRDFWRVRIGIGRPARGELHAHVLGRFSPDEEARMDEILDTATTLIRRGYREGFPNLPARTSAL